MGEQKAKRDGGGELRSSVVPPSIDALRCPHCAGRSFRHDSVRRIGWVAILALSLSLILSAIQITMSVNSAVDWLIVLFVSPLPYSLVAAAALLFGGSLSLRICESCGYTFTFDGGINRSQPQL